MSTTTEAPKKHITQLTAESKEFWQPLFNHMKLTTFQFGAKIGYLGKEFESEGLGRVPAVRFFRNELSKGDFYMELFNFDDTYYHSGVRKLYRLRYNANWESDSKNYKKIEHPKFETFAVKMSDFELVNETSIKALFPEVITEAAIATPTVTKKFVVSEDGPVELKMAEKMAAAELDFRDVEDEVEKTIPAMFAEQEDANANQMTMRDYYCMLQNAPLSNKKWLNELIMEGRKWQK